MQFHHSFFCCAGIRFPYNRNLKKTDISPPEDWNPTEDILFLEIEEKAIDFVKQVLKMLTPKSKR